MPSCDGANCSACNCNACNCGSDITQSDVRNIVREELSRMKLDEYMKYSENRTPSKKEKELSQEVVRLTNELLILRGKIKEEANKEVIKRLEYLAEQEGIDVSLLIPTLKEKSSNGEEKS